MKVTVCFENVRVIVPCGDGGLLVKDLTEKAVARYRKATGKPNDTCVTVHSLKSLNDGGILDCDDCVNAVADDREQIIAIFDEQTSLLPHNNAGDGSSGNSEGTESPDLFRGGGGGNNFLSKPEINYSATDVEIPDKGLPLGVTPLQVRRGSEPALNRLSPDICSPTINKNNNTLPINSLPYSVDPKRWSSAVAGMFTGEEDKNNNNKVPPNTAPPVGNYSDQTGSKEMLLPPPGDRGEGSGREEGKSAFSRFSRDSVRLSMLGSEALARWAEAADRQMMKMQTTDGRREPLGGSATSPDVQSSDSVFSFPPENRFYDAVLKKEDGPLGIHVVPNSDQFGRGDGCLFIQGIEHDGRIAKDGRFQIGDKIEEINGISLLTVNFRMAQDIFKNALLAEELRLRLKKAPKAKIPLSVLPKPQTSRIDVKQRNGDPTFHDNNEDKGINAKVATVSPTKKPNTISNTDTMLAANTRKIGKRIHIQLVKGSEGLGFSITTRDNPAAGNCPIYIKSILPKGAAIRDGRLKIRDRLLIVNNQEMTGLEQKQAVAILRNTPHGGTVDLVVSRQDVVEGAPPEEPPPIPPNLPRQLSTKNDDNATFPWKDRKVFTFDIPLSDTGSAGLGISIKGKTSTGPNGSVDLGIFVKSVIHGGAASKDGRLKPNDQLVNINGSSLLSVTNADAMETLRYAMFNNEGPHLGAITLTVARNIFLADTNISHNSTSNSDNLISFESPDTSENAENTVVFQPKEGEKNTSFESSRIEDKDLGLDTVFPNPVIDRLKGNTSNSLRNESYLRTSQDNWNSQSLQQGIYGSMRHHDDSSCLVAPTINLPSADTVIIEDPYGTTPPKLLRNQMDPTATNLSSIENNFPSRDNICPDGGPASPKRKPDNHDFTFVSELSLNDDSDTFARDGFGRQSMSEKRHAQLDARNTDTFQRNKLIREERERQRTTDAEMLKKMENNESSDDRMKGNTLRSHSVKVPNANGVNASVPKKEYGPSLGLKKSSSLESLHTLVHETQRQEDEAEDFYARSGGRGGRGRGCNESFRAAVDRSYDGPGQLSEGHSAMETLDEESESGSHYAAYNTHHQHTRTAPGFQVTSQTISHTKTAHDDMLNPYNSKRQNYDKIHNKKKGLFKGLGHMFKFGKQKRNEDAQKQSQQELERQQEQERVQARRAAQDEQERIQEQYKLLLERQRRMEQQNQHHVMVTSSQPSPANQILNDQNCGSQSRQERIYQLRAQHQRKHQERQGQYPQDEQEEQYERQIQEQVDRQKSRQHLYIKHYQRQIANQYTGKIYAQLPHKTPQHRRTQSQRYYQGSKQYQSDQPIIHSRSNSYDPLKEMERPGSRKGFADPSPGRGKAIADQYNHYMNYEEIQYHMRQFQQKPDRISHHNQPISRPSHAAGQHGERFAGSNIYDYDRLQNQQKQRAPLQAIETNSLSHHNHSTPPYIKAPAPMPEGGIPISSHQRTPRHLPPEIPHSAKRGDSQNIYGQTPIKSPNQLIYGQSPRQPPTPSSFQNVRSPPSYQNSSYGSSSNSRDSSTPGSKV